MSHIREFELLDPDDNNRKQKFDSLFQAIYTMPVEHHEIHDAHSFMTGYADITLGLNATIIFAFKTPAGSKLLHMVVGFETLVKAHVDIIEAPGWSASTGSQNPVYNRNREDAGSSVILENTTGSFIASDNVILDPSSFTGGTIIDTLYAFGVKNKSSGSNRGIDEIVLAANTNYGVRLTSDDGSNAAHLKLSWYEHTNE